MLLAKFGIYDLGWESFLRIPRKYRPRKFLPFRKEYRLRSRSEKQFVF